MGLDTVGMDWTVYSDVKTRIFDIRRTLDISDRENGSNISLLVN